MLGIGVGAAAASGNETISALLNREITVNYNGVKQSFTDTSGNAVYPISYNGSTYLPVRAVSNLLGLPIAYDAPTNTINMGSTDRQPTNVTSLKNSGGNDYTWIINDKTELSVAGSDGAQTYSTGIMWDIWNSSSSTSARRVMYFECSGYSEVTFTAWADVDCNVSLFDQDYKVIESFELKGTDGGAFATKTIAIPAGTSKIAFGADSVEIFKNGTMKILDPTIK